MEWLFQDIEINEIFLKSVPYWHRFGMSHRVPGIGPPRSKPTENI
jgi:hypothetical protein